jgi:MFS family permease
LNKNKWCVNIPQLTSGGILMLKSLKRIHWSIYVLASGSGFLVAGFLMLIPVIPVYAETHGFNDYQIGLLVGAFMLGRFTFQFPMGVVSDHIGRKTVMVISLLLFSISTILYALNTDAWILIGFRLIQGIASGAYFIGFQSYINDRTPTDLRGLANSLNTSAIHSGTIIGPILGGFIYEAINIRAPFLIGGFLGLFLLPVVLSVPGNARIDTIRKWGVLIPKTSSVKRVLKRIFVPQTLSLSFIHFLQLLGSTIILIAISLIAAQYLEWSAGTIALAFAFSGIASVISSPFVGRLSDRQGFRVKMVIIGLIAVAIQCLIFYFHSGTILTFIGFIVGGAGVPAYYNSFFALIGDLTQVSDRGTVGGFIGSFGEFGSFLGSSLIGPFLWTRYNIDVSVGLCFLFFSGAILLAFLTRSFIHKQMGRMALSQ